MIEIIEANIVGLRGRETYPARITLSNGVILDIERTVGKYETYVIPGFIDSHVHIESSLMTPANFAEAALKHGVVGAVADPHEIANVLGVPGIDFMINNGRQSPFYFWFGLPSCIPSTNLEESGATIDGEMTEILLKRDDLHFLGEMMNYPGVINQNKDVVRKIKAAKTYNKPIDGHAPSLNSDDLAAYAAAGISTDHECTTKEEAVAKIKLGMKVLIREGSAARNFDALHTLYSEYPDNIMLCTDDMPASTLLDGYLHKTVVKALSLGYNLYDVLQSASGNTAKHYNLPIGMVEKGDSADFLIVENLQTLPISKVYIKGKKVFDKTNKNITIIPASIEPINRFDCSKITSTDLEIVSNGDKIRVIDCIDGDLTTQLTELTPTTIEQKCVSDTQKDILKLVAMSRYKEKELSVGFIRGIGLKTGAMATSISHDNHNIVAVGCSDDEITLAINTLIENKGGMVVVEGDQIDSLPLEIAGLMTNLSAEEVAKRQSIIKNRAISLGSTLEDPFLTLAFMSLIVIPKIKLSSKGLFDVEKFKFTNLFVQ